MGQPSVGRTPLTVVPTPGEGAAEDAFQRCASGRTLHEVCEGLTDDLLELGFSLPSVYLLTGDRLRCHGARGYFQVVDGFSPGTGVVGGVVASGRTEFLPDVRARPDFVGAVPDLMAEVCVPVRCWGEVVGAVNVESRTVLPPDTPQVLEAAAELLGARIQELGGLPQPSPSQRLAQIAVELTAAASVSELEQRAVDAAIELSRMSTAAVARLGTRRSRVTCAGGPLAAGLRGLSSADLEVMAGWVRAGTSSHFPAGSGVHPGYGFLSTAGVRALSVHPLVVRGEVRGLLLLADEQPVVQGPAMVDMLELLAAQTAAALAMAALLHELAERAEEDELTGLANRAGFERALAAAVACSAGTDEQVAVLLLDLDDFKHVNDSLGHQAGDRMLIEVASRLRAALRVQDTACRLGGDEFVAVLPGVSLGGAVVVAQRLLAAVARVPSDTDAWLMTTASVGVALSDRDDAGSADLLRAADLAMYLAKEQGKGGYAVFEPHLRTAAVERLDMTRELRRALVESGLHLAFQPVVDLGTGAMTGVEALVRWDHPQRGSIPPSDFVELAEQTGDIGALGAWVLRTACGQLLEWDAAGGDGTLGLCVNVSTRQLERPGLVETVDACLAAGLGAGRLVLEITETALSHDGVAATAALRRLRERGVTLAVDDFGTGYSSLGRLRSAPVTLLKVDRTFISEIDPSGRDVPIVDATLAMAAGLGLGVVAEGVETREQLEYLRRHGCPQAQGYLLSPPLTPAAVLALLRGPLPWAGLFEP
jgi:diguanylate cyclase (GGDEF)-like protein